jgi:hypothetical protein
LAEPAGPIFLYLRPIYQEALKRRAEELGISEADAASRLIEHGLEPFLEQGADVDQARAETQLVDLAAKLAKEEVERSSDWNERLTFAVFERIRTEHRSLYDLAVRGNRREIVNRRIGRQIRATVGAQVKKRNGRPVTFKVPRGSDALISDYTLLLRPAH